MTPASDSVRPRSKSVPGIAALVLLFAGAALYLVLCMSRETNIYDEGVILFGAARALDGAILHRDFHANYGPGQFYVLAALYKIFGASILIERVWDTIVRSCSVVLVYVIVGRTAPRALAVSAAMISLLWLGAFRFYGYPVFPALAADLAGLALLMPILGRTTRPAPGLIASGGCAGLAMLFRYDIGFFTFGAECGILALSAWLFPLGGQHRLRSALRDLVWFGLGFAIVVMPVAAFLAVNGAIPDLIFDIVTFPAQFYVKMRSLPFPGLSAISRTPAKFAVYLPLLICAAAAPTIVTLARRRGEAVRTGPERAGRHALLWALLTLVVLTLVLFGKGVVRVEVVHMAMALITAVALAGMLAQPVIGRGLIGRSLVIAALLAVCAWTCIAVAIGLRQAQQNVIWAMDPASWENSATGMPPASGDCLMPPGLERLACFATDPETIDTIRYVQQRTTPDDPVFIGLSRHDKIFANDVLLYFAMNRKPVTKWYHFEPGLQTAAPIQQEMIADLERAQPKLIVIEAKWAEVIEPNDSALSDATLLDDYLQKTYEPVTRFGTNTILQRRAVD